MGDLKKIGAFWLREGKKGKFMSGQVEVGGQKVSLLVFKNNRKQPGEKYPDYEIFLAGDKKPDPAEDEPL